MSLPTLRKNKNESTTRYILHSTLRDATTTYTSFNLKMRKGIIIIFLISFLIPSFSTLEKTYQTSLWTYDNWRKNEIPMQDIILKSNKKIDGFKKWTRIRLGLISKPVTIDYQSDNNIIQTRIEPYFLLTNNLIIAFVLSILFIVIKKIKNQCQHCE